MHNIIFLVLLGLGFAWIDGFVLGPKVSNRARLISGSDVRICSSLASATVDASSTSDISNPIKGDKPSEIRPSYGPLSMTIEELSQFVDGTGRALAAWDCYRIGVDPLIYYNPIRPDEDIDASVQSATLHTSSSKQKNVIVKPTTREDILKNHMPVKRRADGLGRHALNLLHSFGRIEGGLATLSHIRTSSDGTTKLLIRFSSDGMEVETVIIPWHDRGRSTLCVSSQVGCKQGCTFCATGRMGKLRSLTSDEILCQVYFAHKVCRVHNIAKIDNVVFMGMGEPADNVDAVVRAASILTDRQLYQMAQSRVTISTVAPTPDAFVQLGQAPAALAWSVHASRDEIRKQLVPTTQYTMEELRLGYVEAMRARSNKLRTTMLEVALIRDVNDGVEDANHMANFALKLVEDVPGIKVVVNLIPFNDIGHPTYKKPTMEQIWAYQDILLEHGVATFIRTTRGDDESAACGQLATKKKKVQGP